MQSSKEQNTGVCLTVGSYLGDIYSLSRSLSQLHVDQKNKVYNIVSKHTDEGYIMLYGVAWNFPLFKDLLCSGVLSLPYVV